MIGLPWKRSAPSEAIGPHVSQSNGEWIFSGWSATASGKAISADNALTYSAVYAAVRLISETLAALPLVTYKRTGDGKERDPRHPLYVLLHDAPNRWMTSYEFRELMQGHLLLRGNAYAQIIRDQAWNVKELIPLHPDRVTAEAVSSGMVYTYKPEDGPARTLYNSQGGSWEVLHVKGLSTNGITGQSVIAYARENIGLALATEENAARLFKNLCRPSGWLKFPGKLNDEQKKNLKRSISEQSAGGNVHGVLVLDQGLEWNQIGVSNKDSQWLEGRAFNVQDVARWFNVPPHMIGDLSHATFSNIEHQGINFVRHTMLPWVVRWEQAMFRDLLLPGPSRRHEIKFVVDGLLRGDAQSRAAYYQTMFSVGALSVNQIRELENWNALGKEGDKHFIPLNMVELSQAGEPQADQPAPDQGGLGDDQRAAAPEGFLEAFEAALVRLVTKECKALGSKPDGLMVRANELYGRFEAQLREAVEPLARCYCSAHRLPLAGAGDVCAAWAAAWVKDSQESLFLRAEVAPESLPELLELWAEHRATNEAARLIDMLEGGNDGN